jgi:TetR/AcrR family tetracycline transcriptional repressor
MPRARTKAPVSADTAADATATPLSRESVLAAALTLIDQRGVEAFSVRDLARSLGVYPTALYWHVPGGRNALIAGAVTAAVGALEPPDAAGDWQAELRALFARYRRAVQRHPRIAPVLGAQLVSNASLDPLLLESILALLESAGFADQGLFDAYNVVIAAMVSFVTLELAPQPEDDPDGWAAGHQARLAQIDATACPTLARHLPQMANRAFVVRWSSGSTHPLDAGFDAWTEVVVQGLAARLPRNV